MEKELAEIKAMLQKLLDSEMKDEKEDMKEDDSESTDGIEIKLRKMAMKD